MSRLPSAWRQSREGRGIAITAIVLSAVNAGAGLFMLALTYWMATRNALEFYPSTRYVMYQAGGAAAVGLIGLLIRFIRFPALVVSSAALAVLFIPWYYASTQWPGGDDGGAFGWFIFGGAACLMSLAVGLGTGITALVLGVLSLVHRRHPRAVPVHPAPGGTFVWPPPAGRV